MCGNVCLRNCLNLSSVSSFVVCGSCTTTEAGKYAAEMVARSMRFLAFASVSCAMRVSIFILLLSKVLGFAWPLEESELLVLGRRSDCCSKLYTRLLGLESWLSVVVVSFVDPLN